MSGAGSQTRETMAPQWQSADELESDLGKDLLRFAASLAEAKRAMGVRISEWVTSAPTLEASVAAAAIAQDELGHARALFAMFRNAPYAPPDLLAEGDAVLAKSRAFPALEAPFDSWFDVAASSAVLDEAFTAAIEASKDSRFAPLRQRAAKILQEERFHRIFGASWLKRLAGQDEESRVRLQRSLDAMRIAALSWLRPGDGARIAPSLVGKGIVSCDASSVEKSWNARVGRSVRDAGLVWSDES